MPDVSILIVTYTQHQRLARCLDSIANEGSMLIGLADLRRESATADLRTMLTLSPMQSLSIPPGVLHGFFHPVPSLTVNATSHEYDPDDDLAVRFDDPDVGLDWPTPDPVQSDRDRHAPAYAVFLEQCASAGLAVADLRR